MDPKTFIAVNSQRDFHQHIIVCSRCKSKSK